MENATNLRAAPDAASLAAARLSKGWVRGTFGPVRSRALDKIASAFATSAASPVASIRRELSSPTIGLAVVQQSALHSTCFDGHPNPGGDRR